jgi:hypothetical protein
MRNLLIIVLTIVHLFGNTELGQLIRLPQLITHYHKHNANTSVTFLQFLLMHYAGKDGTTTDDNDDMKLPCHDYHHTAIFTCYTAVNSMDQDPDELFYSSHVVYGGRLIVYNPSEHIFSFLQPPRTV